ncbi:unnamed protein product [Cylindrotheca closterium]|uniref:Uncharacterized protein n=1 Tax=Cylindrotheca closterium TaxID=2856 RepID=A0AAD2CNL0_9STRA|nr:unnamed protein product [Cylindrotheca closterium]
MPTTRRVTINPNVKFHEILTIYDYNASEIRATWYDEAEMDRIAQKCCKIVKELDGGSAKQSKYCIRGLETHTRLGSIRKRSNRVAAKTAVLEEQENQLNENKETDVQAISDAYRCTTSSCQMWAQVVGSRDHKEVEAYLYDGNDDDEEEEDPVGRKHSPSSTIFCSQSQESKIVMWAASTASATAIAA